MNIISLKTVVFIVNLVQQKCVKPFSSEMYFEALSWHLNLVQFILISETLSEFIYQESNQMCAHKDIFIKKINTYLDYD